jgi:hypothetical protein
MQRSATYSALSVLASPVPEDYYSVRPFGALLPPLTVLVVGGLLALLAFRFITPGLAAAGERLFPPIELAQPGKPATSAPDSQLAAFFTPEVRYWEPQILAWAKQWSLDPNLIATVMQIESCGDPQALSPSGAMGLFQVMPFHFAEKEDTYDPQVNAKRGLDYLRQAFDARSGQVRGVLASYNAGISGASSPEDQWPDQTRRYAAWGSGIYADAQQGNTQSPTLQQWLGAGGAHLCQQANSHLGLANQ